MIYKGSTPELIFDLSSFDLSELSNVNIYFQQGDHSWLFDSITIVDNEQRSYDEKSVIDFETSELKLSLSLKDTYNLTAAVDLHIQLKLTLGNKTIATEYFTEYVSDSMSSEDSVPQEIIDRIEVLEDDVVLIHEELNEKQDTLIAGNNITIENNVISATGGGSTNAFLVEVEVTENEQSTTYTLSKTWQEVYNSMLNGNYCYYHLTNENETEESIGPIFVEIHKYNDNIQYSLYVNIKLDFSDPNEHIYTETWG